MTQERDLKRALWLAAKAAGGTLRIGPSILQDYPGDKHAFVTTHTDKTFGDLVIDARVDGEARPTSAKNAQVGGAENT